jgi:hypothetical protein
VKSKRVNVGHFTRRSGDTKHTVLVTRS